MLSSESLILISMYDRSDLHDEMLSRKKQYQQAGKKPQRMGEEETEIIKLKSSAGTCVWRAHEPRPTANMCTDQAVEVQGTKYMPGRESSVCNSAKTKVKKHSVDGGKESCPSPRERRLCSSIARPCQHLVRPHLYGRVQSRNDVDRLHKQVPFSQGRRDIKVSTAPPAERQTALTLPLPLPLSLRPSPHHCYSLPLATGHWPLPLSLPLCHFVWIDSSAQDRPRPFEESPPRRYAVFPRPLHPPPSTLLPRPWYSLARSLERQQSSKLECLPWYGTSAAQQ